MTKPFEFKPDLSRDERIRQIVARYRGFLAEEKAPEIEQITEQFPDLMPDLQRELNKVRMIHAAMQQANPSDAPSSSQSSQEGPAARPNEKKSDTTSQASLDTHSKPSVTTRSTSGEDAIPITIDVVERANEAALLDTPISSDSRPMLTARSKPKVPPPEELRMFGDYQLLEEIGLGGMGVVYKARQLSLNRTVAIKMILAGDLASEGDLERFQAEAEAAAALRHSGIVQIYEISEHNGNPFFSMEYVEGQSLAEMIREHPLPQRKAAEYVRKLAATMAYAHERGVLHRDLKPANVLIDTNDEPRITDFGLAKRVGVDSMTATGQILGTPSYMPPEQALGEQSQVGTTSDVYALGALLYALVTGRPPFQAETAAAILMLVVGSELLRPSELNPRVHTDLEAICLKCLEKTPENRYASAEILEAELGRYLRGEPILAKPITRLARFWRLCRRNPLPATFALVACIAMIAGTGVSNFFAIESLQQARIAETNAEKAEGQRIRAETALVEVDSQKKLAEDRLHEAQLATYDLTLSQVASLWRNDPSGALRLLESEQFCPSPLRDFTWRHYHWATRRDAFQLDGHLNEVKQVVSIGDSNLLASCGRDGTVRVWDLEQAACVQTFPGVEAVAVSRNGDSLATSQRDGSIKVFDRNPGSLRVVLRGHKSPPSRLAFSRDGKLLASLADGKLLLWRLDAPDLSQATKIEGMVKAFAFSPADDTLFLADRENNVILRNTKTDEHHKLYSEPGSVTAIGVSFDGKKIATACAAGVFRDRVLTVWDLETARIVSQVDDFRGNRIFHALEFSPNGEELATGGGGAIHLWKVDGLELTQSIAAGFDAIQSIAWSSQGDRIAGCGNSPVIKVWLSNARQDLLSRKIAMGGNCVACSPDQKTLAVASTDNELYLLNASDLHETGKFVGHTDQVLSVAWTPDGKGLATGGLDGTMRLWDVATGTSRVLNQSTEHAAHTVACSADGKYLAWGEMQKERTTSNSHRIHYLHRSEGEGPRTLGNKLLPYYELAFSPRDGWLVAAGYSLRLWPLDDQPKSKELIGHSAWQIRCVTFARESATMATGSLGGELIVWDLPNERPRITIPPVGGMIDTIALTPDGNLLAVGGRDKVIRIWSTETGRLRAVLEGHLDGVRSVQFIDNGQTLASTSYDGTVRLWGAAKERDGTMANWSEYSLMKNPLDFVSAAPDAKDRRPVRGKVDAPITAITYLSLNDSTSPIGTASRRAYLNVKGLVEEFPNEVNWVFCHFAPNKQPDQEFGYLAASAGEWVYDSVGNDAFWRFADSFFALPRVEPNKLLELAKKAGVDDEVTAIPVNRYKDFAILQKQKAQIYGKIREGPAIVIVDNRRDMATIVRVDAETRFSADYFRSLVKTLFQRKRRLLVPPFRVP